MSEAKKPRATKVAKTTTKAAPVAKVTAVTEPATTPKTEESVAVPAQSANQSAGAVVPETTASAPNTVAGEPVAVTAPTSATASVFAGQVVVLTGVLLTMKRDEAQKLLAAAGARLGDGVTKQTTLLIYGARAGSKLSAAKKLNISLMTEAEMVAHLTQLPANQESLGEAARRLAMAEAEDQLRTVGLRAEIEATNASYLGQHGLTLPQLLGKYFQLFAKRPDVFVTNYNQGQPASLKSLLPRQNFVPAQWLSVHAEIGAFHFSWVFTADKAERAEFSEGYKGGRIALPDPEKFRWWPRQDWQVEHYDFKYEAVFDYFVNEGITKLSYGNDEEPRQAALIFDNANDCVRHPLGSIFAYLTNGARAGFTWYWQMGPGEFTRALFAASLPRDTSAATVEELLQKQGLDAAEARAMRSWLGDAAVILLHQSLIGAD